MHLPDVLKCGECGSYFKRCTWSKKGVKKIVWRCISRLEYGTRYCKISPTVNENDLKVAIVRALNQFQMQDNLSYQTLLASTIEEALGLNENTDEIELLERRIDSLNRKMMMNVEEIIQNGQFIEESDNELKEFSDEI